MSFFLSTKINRYLVANVNRTFALKKSTEAEVPVKNVAPAEESPVKAPELPASSPSTPLIGLSGPAGEYQVCRPRTSPLSPSKRDVHNETDAARKAIAMQHLQPAMLPVYYTKPIDLNATCVGWEPNTESDIKGTGKNRHFEDSMTRMNITLPLKAPKLASPFPDPVKVMESHTVSDREKADQMLAETKTMKAHAESKKRRSQRQSSTTMAGQSTRNYSTVHYRRFDENPGRKLTVKRVPPERIVQIRKKLVLPSPKAKHLKTTRFSRIVETDETEEETTDDRRKVKSPYPSYSEACPDEIFNRLKGCRYCQYRAEAAQFRTHIQQLHSTSYLTSTKKKDKGNWTPGNTKKPCQYIPPQDDFSKLREKKSDPRKKKKKKKDPKSKKKAAPPSMIWDKIVDDLQEGSGASLGGEMDGWLGKFQSTPGHGGSNVDRNL